MVVASSGPAQDRVNNLTVEVERLEAIFASNFAQWDKLNLPSAAHYFQASYAEVIDVLARISAEERAKDVDENSKPHLKALFKRSVKLLSRSVRYVKKAKTAIEPVHKLLLEDVRRLNQRHDLNGLNGLLEHLVKMSGQLAGIWPPARNAWTENGSDLKQDKEFDVVFQRFRDLDKVLSRRTQDDYELYAQQSWVLLRDACKALHIPQIHTDPGEDFFNNETRPTYLDYPQRSKECLYGRGKRPGILTIKASLGAPLLQKQKKAISQASKRAAEPTPQGANKRPRTESGYSMTIVNATADLEDVLRDSQFWTPRDENIERPHTARLVTPTCENRKQLLAAYREELRSIADSLYKKRFKAPLHRGMLPSTAEEREAWLRTATNEIRTARASVNMYIDDAGSPARAKQLRLAAYRLKLSRALYMIGLYSGTPGASRAEIRTALRDRLDDWILHERAWTVGDQYLLDRTSLTDETFEVLQFDNQTRDGNIREWRELKKGLGKKPQADGGAKKVNDAAGQQQQQEKSGPATQHGGPVLTKQQIENANKILRRVMNPRLPGEGDYARDVVEEGRRRRWFDKVAAAKLQGKPIPKWQHKRIVNPFSAGGPPGWKDLPTGTNWERFKYMWVLSFWRLYQLKELEY
ncbi:hypothetical protein F4803DRAFT_568421 [Xylaria telfairii]|nr:hypothetical protein F4803DRAFT_568421 [Xylaria telfairii]